MPGARKIATAVGGPIVIAGLVLFALRGVAFHDRLTNEHPDVLAFWLPRWAFLGRSLAAGHVPLWNPFEMIGYRFAADPQSGWLSLPPMALFSTLGPGTAMRAMVVLNPLIGGWGLYAFCRVEGMGRLPATAAGASMAAMMSTSELAISMPFAGALAWSTVALSGAAGFRRAGRWSRRLAWLGLAALAWSQVASAHLSHGLAMCTLLLVVYLVAGVAIDLCAERAPGRALVGRTGLFLVVLPLASVAVLVPRLSFIGDSSLGSGYDRMGATAVTGVEEPPIRPDGVWSGWIVAHAAAPGAYAGSAVLLGVPLALRARRRRALVWAMALPLLLVWVGLLDVVVGSSWARELALRLPFGDVVLHNPGRLRYVAVLALPVLGAVGLQGLRDDPLPWPRALPWLAAGAALWLGVPLVSGADLSHWQLFAAALLPASVAWLAWARGVRGAGIALTAVLAAELCVGAVLSGRWSGDDLRLGLESGDRPILAIQPLRAPDVDLHAFLAPGPFVEVIGPDRYLTWVPPQTYDEKGYLLAQEPIDWPALTNERGTLFGVRDVLGYNPVQLPGYWTYIRTTNELSLLYNASAIQVPTPSNLVDLGVRYLIVPGGISPPVPGEVVATTQGYDLVEVGDGARVTVRAGDRSARGEASYEETDPEHARIVVRAVAPSLVVIHSAFDDGWSATVDGVPAAVRPVDGFLQGVDVAAGTHEIALTYGDQEVWTGLWISAAMWLTLGVAIVVTASSERRRRARATPSPVVEARPR